MDNKKEVVSDDVRALFGAIYRCASVDGRIPKVLAALGYQDCPVLLDGVRDPKTFVTLCTVACEAAGLGGEAEAIFEFLRSRGVGIEVFEVVDVVAAGGVPLHDGSLHLVRMRSPSGRVDPNVSEWSCFPYPQILLEGGPTPEGDLELAESSRQSLLMSIESAKVENASLERLKAALSDEGRKAREANEGLARAVRDERKRTAKLCRDIEAARECSALLQADIEAAQRRCDQDMLLLNENLDRLKRDAFGRNEAAKAQVELRRRELQSAIDREARTVAGLEAKLADLKAAYAKAAASVSDVEAANAALEDAERASAASFEAAFERLRLREASLRAEAGELESECRSLESETERLRLREADLQADVRAKDKACKALAAALAGAAEKVDGLRAEWQRFAVKSPGELRITS